MSVKHFLCVLLAVGCVAPQFGFSFVTKRTGTRGLKHSKCKATKFRALEDALLMDGEWVDFQTYTDRYTGNARYFETAPVIATEVSQVPCAARGCCNLMVHLRPNTTDWVVFKEVFIDGGFDPVLEMLDNPKTIVDAGAYAGFTSTLLALLYPDAQIIMVEPDPSNFMSAKLNTHRFANVKAVNVALWSKTACISLVATEGEWGHVFKENASKRGKCQGGLRAVSLSQILARFGITQVDYLKLDVEGAEFQVFNEDSDLAWIRDTQLISVETHDRLAHHFGRTMVSDVVEKTLTQHGFQQFKHHELEFWHPARTQMRAKKSAKVVIDVEQSQTRRKNRKRGHH